MKTIKTALSLSTLVAALTLLFSGCYTRVVSEDENQPAYWNPDTTYQTQNADYDDNGRYGDHVYLGFEYYTPSPYWGYDSWYYGNSYYPLSYYSPWYYSAAFLGYPFLDYPYYQYPYYSVYHHGHYGGYGYFASAGEYGTRNSGYTRRNSLHGLFENSGRGSSGGYVSSPGSGYAIPGRGGARASNAPAGASNRSGTTRTATTGAGNIPTRANAGRMISNGANVPARGQAATNQHQGPSYSGSRSGYTRSSGASRHEGNARPSYAPSYAPSRASAPHYSPPPARSGGERSSGSQRSGGGSGGRRR